MFHVSVAAVASTAAAEAEAADISCFALPSLSPPSLAFS